MSTIETIATRSGVVLQVGKDADEGGLQLKLHVEGRRPFVLHWGLRQPGHDGWQLPPPTAWPDKTKAAGAAVQTPFPQENGDITIRLPAPISFSSLDFVLFFPEQRAWDN